MSSRPGAPQSTTDEYLKAILAELRELNARLSQDTTISTDKVEVKFDFGTPDRYQAQLEFDELFTRFLRDAMRRGDLP